MNIAATFIPIDEPQRMSAVRRYDILDTPPDGMFDRVTALAARRFNVPISIISIVDHDRIWFKSHHGIDVKQIGRDPGLCASAILTPNPHVLEDASKDLRSLANPLVAGDFGLRFYAGVPLRTRDGFNLGTLCVIDKEPRPIEQRQIDDLKDLASVVMDQLELRLSARKAIAKAEMLAREIDHRVMNSLQFISNMLSLQARSRGADDSAAQLEIAATRISAVARVHRHFYTEEAGSAVSGLTYIERLCADLSDILQTPIGVEGDEGNLATTLVQPVGLILNELITNAAKHGAGKISVSYRVSGDARILQVCDQGKGIPADFNPDNAGTGLGMKVVNALTQQLRGTLTAGRIPDGNGSCFTVRFPA
jgi:two-component sensor histidine kinase